MKNIKNGLPVLIGTILFLLWQPSIIKAQSGQVLYRFEKAVQPVLKEENKHYLSVLQKEDTYVGHRIFRFKVHEFEKQMYAEVLNLPLFDFSEDMLTAIRIQTEERGDGDFTWLGKPDPYQGGIVALTVKGGYLAGRIQVGAEVFLIRSIGDDLYALVKVDASVLPQDEPDEDYEDMKQKKVDPQEEKEDPDFFYRKKTSFAGSGNFSAGSPQAGNCKVRLLIAYTDDVAAAHSGILAILQNEVDVFNQINANSTVDHRVETAIIVEVNYNEAANNSLSSKLADFSGSSDGNMDEIHTLRNLYDADICGLVFETGQGCGKADAIGATYSSAFQVTRYDCFSQYSLQHEFGHLYNCRHDHAADNGGLIYNHGYVHAALSSGNPFRTVMAYASGCTGGLTCPRIPYFSDYQVSYLGDPVGVVNYAHNERIIDNNWDATIAAFQNYEINKTVWASDVINSQEEANITASSTITTDVAQITYLSGSQGTYTAGSSIRLLAGFRAAKGSKFRAYLDNCTNNFFAPGTDGVADAKIGDDNQSIMPSKLQIMQGDDIAIYPNPSQGSFKVVYSVQEAQSPVFISLFDASGRLVAEIFQKSSQPKGDYSVKFDASSLPGGIYYCRVITGKSSIIKSVTILE